MKTVLIVGIGNIGQRLVKEYATLQPECYDPYKNIDTRTHSMYDFAFIAVDTPAQADGKCDISAVRRAVEDTRATIIVIRSTIPPGTTEELIDSIGKRIVYSPEFYGTTQHSDPHNFNFDFTILGGHKDNTEPVAQLLQGVYNGNHRFCFTDARTAELTKYFENTMLAAKVSLCAQFYQIAKQVGVNYSEMRELLLQDPRINRSHTFVYEDHPYWESHCFDKDLAAVINFANAPLIEDIIKYNNSCKDT